jgi:protein-S-isoprenylcysteine O-methyltransferase Ste14
MAVVIMKSLELKVPPPLVGAIFAAAMWGIAPLTPVVEVAKMYRIWAATVISVTGGCFAVGGLVAFRRARTTVNPMKPEAASSLVASGVYRITRNPMYVGLLLVLIALTILLAAPFCGTGGLRALHEPLPNQT